MGIQDESHHLKALLHVPFALEITILVPGPYGQQGMTLFPKAGSLTVATAKGSAMAVGVWFPSM